MLSLRDFFHLPQVDPFIERITHTRSGLIIIAGMDPRAHVDPAKILPSGRAGIFRILVRQILDENPRLQATLIAENRDAFRVTRSLRRRVNFQKVDIDTGYNELIPALAHQNRQPFQEALFSPRLLPYVSAGVPVYMS